MKRQIAVSDEIADFYIISINALYCMYHKSSAILSSGIVCKSCASLTKIQMILFTFCSLLINKIRQ